MKYYLSITFLILTLLQVKASTTLISNSPFTSGDEASRENLLTKTTSFEKKGKRFVLKGVTQINGIYCFSIYDKKSEKSEWIEPFQEINGFKILRYLPETFTIIYSLQGVENQLTLISAQETDLSLSLVSNDKPKALHESDKKPLEASIEFSRQSPYARVYQAHEQKQKTNTARNFLNLGLPQPQPLFASSRNIDNSSLFNSALDSGVISNQNPSDPPIPSSRVNRIHNPSGKTPEHLLY